MEPRDIEELEGNIGYVFDNKELCYNALTHSSYASENGLSYENNNERLEFLGDAVLELISSDAIFKEHPHIKEGQMTRMRAGLVCEKSLADCARDINLGKFLRLGNGEVNFGGCDKDSILSDAFEAVIGAIYIDGGIKQVSSFIERFVLCKEDQWSGNDHKTLLQETIQARGNNTIEYKLIKESGPDHNKSFEFACLIGGVEMGRGKERSKKKAQQKAAYSALVKINEKWSK